MINLTLCCKKHKVDFVSYIVSNTMTAEQTTSVQLDN